MIFGKELSAQEKIKKNSTVQENQCWLWSKHCNPKGYGQTYYEKRPWKAHRLSYAAFVGKIPGGLEIDHLCRNRGCVNPDHLEAVSHHENTLRGDTIPAKFVTRTHCDQGHPYDGDNVYFRTDKKSGRKCRRCRKCQADLARSRDALQRSIL